MMARVKPVALLWLAVFILTLVKHVHPLYFYFEAGSSKCFFEQLPADTIVVGHYYLEEWDDKQGHFDIPTDVSLGILVKHLDSEHTLVNSRGTPDGRFAFNSHEAGNHEICFQTEFQGAPTHAGRLPNLRMHLDIIIGDTHRSNTEADKEHTQDLLSRARALNAKMRDLRKEQQYQREREMEFRNTSESVNSLVVWCIVFQIIVVIICCIWQLFNLRVRITRFSPPDLFRRQKVPVGSIVRSFPYCYFLQSASATTHFRTKSLL